MRGGVLSREMHADAVRQSDPNYQRIVQDNQDAIAKAVQVSRPIILLRKYHMSAKFSVGCHVNHPATDDGKVPASYGEVVEVTPWATGGGYSYKLKCDTTKKVLPYLFKEEELTDKT